MEIAGILISILALFLSIFTYLKHDKKIKRQSKLLNEYQLEKIAKEREEERKAVVEANVITGIKGSRIIKVYNRGKSIAKNVNVKIPENDGYHVYNNPSPIDIRPQTSIEIKISTFLESRPDKIEIEFEWQDDFMEKNTGSQMIQI